MNTYVLRIFLIILICREGYTKCSTNICLTWKVSINSLTLICKVDDLAHIVKISDPYNNVQGDCLPPFKTVKCDSHHKNVTISQNKSTKETICRVVGNITNRVNGNWTCSHGTSKDEANVEVTVLKSDGTDNQNKTKNNISSDNSCLKDVMLFAMGSYLLSVLISLFVLFFIPYNIDVIEGCARNIGIYNGSTTSESINPVKACKRIIYMVVTILYLGLWILVGYFDTIPCDSQYIAFAFGLVVGCPACMLCLLDGLRSMPLQQNQEAIPLQQNPEVMLLQQNPEVILLQQNPEVNPLQQNPEDGDDEHQTAESPV